MRGVHAPLPRRVDAQQRLAQHEALRVRVRVATAGPALEQQRAAQQRQHLSLHSVLEDLLQQWVRPLALLDELRLEHRLAVHAVHVAVEVQAWDRLPSLNQHLRCHD